MVPLDEYVQLQHNLRELRKDCDDAAGNLEYACASVNLFEEELLRERAGTAKLRAVLAASDVRESELKSEYAAAAGKWGREVMVAKEMLAEEEQRLAGSSAVEAAAAKKNRQLELSRARIFDEVRAMEAESAKVFQCHAKAVGVTTDVRDELSALREEFSAARGEEARLRGTCAAARLELRRAQETAEAREGTLHAEFDGVARLRVEVAASEARERQCESEVCAAFEELRTHGAQTKEAAALQLSAAKECALAGVADVQSELRAARELERHLREDLDDAREDLGIARAFTETIEDRLHIEQHHVAGLKAVVSSVVSVEGELESKHRDVVRELQEEEVTAKHFVAASECALSDAARVQAAAARELRRNSAAADAVVAANAKAVSLHSELRAAEGEAHELREKRGDDVQKMESAHLSISSLDKKVCAEHAMNARLRALLGTTEENEAEMEPALVATRSELHHYKESARLSISMLEKKVAAERNDNARLRTLLETKEALEADIESELVTARSELHHHEAANGRLASARAGLLSECAAAEAAGASQAAALRSDALVLQDELRVAQGVEQLLSARHESAVEHIRRLGASAKVLEERLILKQSAVASLEGDLAACRSEVSRCESECALAGRGLASEEMASRQWAGALTDELAALRADVASTRRREQRLHGDCDDARQRLGRARASVGLLNEQVSAKQAQILDFEAAMAANVSELACLDSEVAVARAKQRQEAAAWERTLAEMSEMQAALVEERLKVSGLCDRSSRDRASEKRLEETMTGRISSLEELCCAARHEFSELVLEHESAAKAQEQCDLAGRLEVDEAMESELASEQALITRVQREESSCPREVAAASISTSAGTRVVPHGVGPGTVDIAGALGGLEHVHASNRQLEEQYRTTRNALHTAEGELEQLGALRNELGAQRKDHIAEVHEELHDALERLELARVSSGRLEEHCCTRRSALRTLEGEARQEVSLLGEEVRLAKDAEGRLCEDLRSALDELRSAHASNAMLEKQCRAAQGQVSSLEMSVAALGAEESELAAKGAEAAHERGREVEAAWRGREEAAELAAELADARYALTVTCEAVADEAGWDPAGLREARRLRNECVRLESELCARPPLASESCSGSAIESGMPRGTAGPKHNGSGTPEIRAGGCPRTPSPTSSCGRGKYKEASPPSPRGGSCSSGVSSTSSHSSAAGSRDARRGSRALPSRGAGACSAEVHGAGAPRKKMVEAVTQMGQAQASVGTTPEPPVDVAALRAELREERAACGEAKEELGRAERALAEMQEAAADKDLRLQSALSEEKERSHRLGELAFCAEEHRRQLLHELMEDATAGDEFVGLARTVGRATKAIAAISRELPMQP